MIRIKENTPNKYRQQQVNQWLRGPSEKKSSGGDEVPTRLVSEGIKIIYDDLHETSLTSASTVNY
jgi:hypothetical protein